MSVNDPVLEEDLLELNLCEGEGVQERPISDIEAQIVAIQNAIVTDLGVP